MHTAHQMSLFVCHPKPPSRCHFSDIFRPICGQISPTCGLASFARTSRPLQDISNCLDKAPLQARSMDRADPATPSATESTCCGLRSQRRPPSGSPARRSASTDPSHTAAQRPPRCSRWRRYVLGRRDAGWAQRRPAGAPGAPWWGADELQRRGRAAGDRNESAAPLQRGLFCPQTR